MVGTCKETRELKVQEEGREVGGCNLSKERQARMARNRQTTVSSHLCTRVPLLHVLPMHRIFHVCILQRLRICTCSDDLMVMFFRLEYCKLWYLRNGFSSYVLFTFYNWNCIYEMSLIVLCRLYIARILFYQNVFRPILHHDDVERNAIFCLRCVAW